MDSTFTKSQILGLFGVFFVLMFAEQWYMLNRWSSSTPAVSSAISSSSITSSTSAISTASGKAVPIPFGRGKIVTVSSGVITVAILQNPSATLLKLSISQNTKIEEGRQIPASESASLMQDYFKKYAKDGFSVSPPQLFTSTKTISLSSLKSGENVVFFLAGAVNTDSKTVPVASIIRILE